MFRPNYVAEYLLNLLVVFNPFFVPLYVKAWIAVKPQNAVERALKFIPVAFIVFSCSRHFAVTCNPNG